MTRLYLIYISLLGLSLSFAGCDSLIYDDQKKPQSEPVVYLSVTKAQAEGLETLNADDIEYEDRVHDLAMLVFDSSSGTKVGEYFDENIPLSEKDKSFIVQLNPGPGQRDFYFVANMPIAALKSITTRSAMESYINTFRDLDTDLYLNATETKGFPMSRIYKNQTITQGGNIYSPLPFRPNGEDRVNLIRVLAKLEVKIDGSTTNLGVKNIYYKNAYRQFSLQSPLTPIVPIFYEDKPSTKTDNLVSSNDWTAWSATGSVSSYTLDQGNVTNLTLTTYINERDNASSAIEIKLPYQATGPLPPPEFGDETYKLLLPSKIERNHWYVYDVEI
ncbi:fimbrial protein [uncultured Dysgonomonas sp.]|nr:fimbrial protein [uncultured Dysgonomonas sp.]